MQVYTQLTHKQRCHIYTIMKAGLCQTEIAEIVGVHKSTISREIRRNRVRRGYRPKQAQQYAVAQRGKAKSRITDEDWELIEQS